MNDMMRYAMEKAAKTFGGSDGMFNLACLSNSITRICGIKGVIDGEILRCLLVGRNDVLPLSGGAHFRLI
jgi:hypothetical protein